VPGDFAELVGRRITAAVVRAAHIWNQYCKYATFSLFCS